MANALIHQASLYLRQHAHNPVDWMPWGEDAFAKAKREDKPVIVSIGYSSCHWCHVMERECFENHEVAERMNSFFVCIKVDREEYPDVDSWYMLSVQMLGIHGGWPLNVFCLTDGKPFYGGTYFPRPHWIKILERIHQLYRQDKQILSEQSEKLQQAMLEADELILRDTVLSDKKDIFEKLHGYSAKCDPVFGGENGAPKFPMPGKYLMLLKYAYASDHRPLLDHIRLSLRNMALRGLFDHLDGGFYRYSTDVEWKIPHFEKMLYDNVQLLELYATAWNCFKDPVLAYTAEKTATFLLENMYDRRGCFFSSIDADSQGKEGEYYTWTADQVQKALGEDAQHLMKKISWGEQTHWEEDRHVLLLWNPESQESFSFDQTLLSHLEKLRQFRKENKIPPQLDRKIILSWNALAVRCFARAGIFMQKKEWIRLALHVIHFLETNLKQGEKWLRIYDNELFRIDARMEDYALLCDAYYALFLASGNMRFVEKAGELLSMAIKIFCGDGIFFMNYPVGDVHVHGNLKDIQDNVIPSTNSVMACSLLAIGKISDNPDFTLHALQMIDCMKNSCAKFPLAYYRWIEAILETEGKILDAVLVGNFVDEMMSEWYERFPINANLLFNIDCSATGIFKNKKASNEQPTLYICKGTACQEPVLWKDFMANS